MRKHLTENNCFGRVIVPATKRVAPCLNWGFFIEPKRPDCPANREVWGGSLRPQVTVGLFICPIHLKLRGGVV